VPAAAVTASAAAVKAAAAAVIGTGYMSILLPVETGEVRCGASSARRPLRAMVDTR
jgi:hypothetical protein